MTQIKNAENVRLFALNSNRPLAESIADRFGHASEKGGEEIQHGFLRGKD